MVQPPDPQDPRGIGRYRILGVLGSGGMGRVLLGEAPDGRRAAIKLVHPELADTEGFRSRFRREVRLAAQAPARWTAAFLDADPDAAQPWMATVYLDAPTLFEQVAAAGTLSPDRAADLGVGLATALGALHARGLVHRDLKPSNVLLTGGGPRLIDFGIARAVDGTALTTTGQVIGTPEYLSPEQITGTPPTGTAADLFALGSLLVFVTTGRTPFAGGAAPAVLSRVVHGEPDLGPNPGRLEPVLRRLLDKDPTRRPDAEQAAELLAGAPSGNPGEGHGGGPVPPAAAPGVPTLGSTVPYVPQNTPGGVPRNAGPSAGQVPQDAPAAVDGVQRNATSSQENVPRDAASSPAEPRYPGTVEPAPLGAEPLRGSAPGHRTPGARSSGPDADTPGGPASGPPGYPPPPPYGHAPGSPAPYPGPSPSPYAQGSPPQGTGVPRNAPVHATLDAGGPPPTLMGAPPDTGEPWRRRRIPLIAAGIAVVVVVAAVVAGLLLRGGADPITGTVDPPPTTAAPPTTAPPPTTRAAGDADLLAGATVVDTSNDIRYGGGGDPLRFRSPSGNIACVQQDFEVRCDVLEHSWQVPPRPASCQLAYGSGAEIAGAAPGALTCAGDTVADPSLPVLEFDRALKSREVTCVSRRTGVECRNTATGHGIAVARASYRVY